MDIEAFFDNVNHDILMSLIARSISDKKLLKLIRSFLNAGMMQNGLMSKRDLGTPQGGPLSPLLSNCFMNLIESFICVSTLSSDMLMIVTFMLLLRMLHREYLHL